MPKYCHAMLLASCLLVIASFNAAYADDDLATQVDIPYEQFTLNNGLTVLVHSDDSTPTVFVGMWYGVGSKDEPEGKTGFAHLFEHLMFQGTENREGEYFSPFTDAGATGMNGTTNSDRTNYYATVPSGALDMALWMESDRMAHLLGAVTQDALDEQRAVVQNEKRQRAARPYAQVSDKVREGLYPIDHPYRHSVIGSMEDLDAASLDDVHEWFNTYYGASNVVLVLAGDVTLADAKEKVAYYFDEVPSGVPLAHPKKWIPQLTENREEMMYDRVGRTRITRVWPIPGLNDPDTNIMYLLNETLVGNKNSPLRKILVDDLQLAVNVAGGSYGRILNGEYTLQIDLNPNVDPQQVIDIVDQTLSEYLQTGPDAQIVENAKLRVNMFMLGALETNSSIGRMLVEGELFSNKPLFINQQLRWLNAATPDSLQAVAKRWLTRGYYQLTVQPFPELLSSDGGPDRTEIPSITANSKIRFPDVETAVLDNGMRVVVATRGNIPLVDVSIKINSGSTAELPGEPGTSNFVFSMLDKGTKKYSAAELAAARDKIGMSNSAGTGLESSSLGYRILQSNLQPSLQLAAEMLRNPTFPAEEFDKEKAKIAAYLANLKHVPAGAASSLFDRVIYGVDHPMGAVWTPELLTAANLDNIAAYHERELTPDNMTVFMIGDISLATASAAVEKAFGKWRARANSAKRAIGSAPESSARVVLVDYPGAESSTIYAGHAVGPYNPATWTHLSVMNRALGGGFESRLNMNLREDKGWSYGYRSRVSPNTSGDMTFYGSGQVQTDKTMASMLEIRSEIEMFLSDKPATENEIERIKLNRTRSLPGSYSTNRGFLGSIISSDSYGLAFNYAESQADRIASVNVNSANSIATATLKPQRLSWLVIGDLEKIEAEVRSLDYGDVEIWDAYGNRLR